jgi:hypothetical protein
LHTTVVVPTANVDPDAREQVGATGPSRASVAETLKVAVAPLDDCASTFSAPGTLTTGGVVSTSVTLTVNEPVLTLPCASAARHATLVFPTGNVAPDAGEQDGAMEPSTVSVAVTAKVAEPPPELCVVSEMSPGRWSCGAVVSTTCTSKEAVALLPCASVARQVTVVAERAKVDPETGVHDGERDPSTASIAEALKVTAAPAEELASRVTPAGTPTPGAVVSRTATVNEAEPVLPCASVARHVTIVEPMGNVAPDAGEHDAGSGPSTLSLADAVKATCAPLPDAASFVTLAGTLTTGGVVSASVTVIENVPVLVFPCVSVAEQCTVVVATGNVAPEAGEQDGATLPSILSFAVAVNDTAAPAAFTVVADWSPGRLRTGGVASPTVMLKDALPVFPCASVTVQEIVVSPSGNADPDAGEQDGLSDPSTVSAADAVKPTTAPAAEVAAAAMSAGTVIPGGVVSLTVTEKLALAVSVGPSVAVQATVVVAIANTLPGAWSQLTFAEGRLLVTMKATAAPLPDVASIVMSLGVVSASGGVSATAVGAASAIASAMRLAVARGGRPPVRRGMRLSRRRTCKAEHEEERADGEQRDGRCNRGRPKPRNVLPNRAPAEDGSRRQCHDEKQERHGVEGDDDRAPDLVRVRRQCSHAFGRRSGAGRPRGGRGGLRGRPRVGPHRAFEARRTRG